MDKNSIFGGKFNDLLSPSSNRRILTYIKSIIFVVIFSELYFYPFDSEFRFSVGIIILNIVVLLFEDISDFLISVLSGLLILLVRVAVGCLSLDLTIDQALIANLPSLVYYFIYGFLHQVIKKKVVINNYLSVLFIFAFIDIFSNSTEALIRESLDFRIFKAILFVGIIRSIIAYLFFILFKSKELYIINMEHQKRYGQLNLLVSNIQGELFYLQKSKKDIEEVMKNSYELYNELSEDSKLSEKALIISRDVHEIKKDYQRVLAGFNNFIDSFENDDSMSIEDAFKIIRDNTFNQIKENSNKDNIHFTIINEDDFLLKNYYSLFTILNNLIINSIEASKNRTYIEVCEKSDEDNIYFYVKDNGVGIPKDIEPFLFNPGFTTKFNYSSGKASTGIGLSHVKSSVEALLGKIELVPSDTQTVFKLTIPKSNIIRW